MCEETGRPSDMMLQYFFARAKGGCGSSQQDSYR